MQCSAEMQFPGFVILRRVVAFSGIWHELRRGGVYRRNVSRAAGALTILWKQYKKSIGKNGVSIDRAEDDARSLLRRSFHKGHILRPSRFHRFSAPSWLAVTTYEPSRQRDAPRSPNPDGINVAHSQCKI